MSTPAQVVAEFSAVPVAGLRYRKDWNGAFGIFLKALRDTASIVFDSDSAIVALSGNTRNSVA